LDAHHQLVLDVLHIVDVSDDRLDFLCLLDSLDATPKPDSAALAEGPNARIGETSSLVDGDLDTRDDLGVVE